MLEGSLVLQGIIVEQWSEPVPMGEPKSTLVTATATAKEALGLDVCPARVGLHSGSQSTCDVGDGWSLVICINDIGSTSARGSRTRLTVVMPQAEYA